MKFTIDMSKWRCGHCGPRNKNSLGEGVTNLLNQKGFQCCLGQCCEQLGTTRDAMVNLASPESMRQTITYFATSNGNTLLSDKAIEINDETSTTITEKQKALRALFRKHGHEIVFSNDPRKKKKGS